MKLYPIKSRIVVRPTNESPWTEAGLYLPISTKPTRGIVVATGPHVREVLPGDEVYYNNSSVTELTIDGKSFVTMPEKDALAMVLLEN